MLKLGSLIGAAIMVAMLTGCESKPKTDIELVTESYNKAINGDAAYIIIVDPKEARKDIEKDGLGNPFSTGISKRFDLQTKKECKINVSKVGGSWAKIDELCPMMGTMTSWTFFMKKDNGIWKAPVID